MATPTPWYADQYGNWQVTNNGVADIQIMPKVHYNTIRDGDSDGGGSGVIMGKPPFNTSDCGQCESRRISKCVLPLNLATDASWRCENRKRQTNMDILTEPVSVKRTLVVGCVSVCVCVRDSMNMQHAA